MQTVHLVQAFIAGKGQALKAEQTLVCTSAEARSERNSSNSLAGPCTREKFQMPQKYGR
jgi:hypothetical protein